MSNNRVGIYTRVSSDTQVIEGHSLEWQELELERYAKEHKLNVIDKVSVSPRIPYDEALGYMLNSQVLLLFGNKNSKQIPAKVYDYFGAEGLIFVILGDENDPIKDVVKNKEKCIVVNNNVDEIVNGINKIASMIELGIKHGAIEEYKWQYISKRLNDILRG